MSAISTALSSRISQRRHWINGLALAYVFIGYGFSIVCISSQFWTANILGVLLLIHTLTWAAYFVHELVHGTVFRQRGLNASLANVMLFLTGSCYCRFRDLARNHLAHHKNRADFSAFSIANFLKSLPTPLMQLIVLPGFVNGHHHIGLSSFQLGSADAPLELWLANRIAHRTVDPYLDTLYSAFQMIESGITTVQHIHRLPGCDRTVWLETANQILKAYQDIGMRVSYCSMVRDQNHLVYAADADFIQRLPPDLGSEVEVMLQAQRAPLHDYMDFFVQLWEQNQNQSEYVQIQLAPANLHWCSDTALLIQKEFAERYQVKLHMHLLETPYQKEYAKRRLGTTAVEHLHQLGLLHSDMTLGHGTWMSEPDIDLIASTGTMICHNASSNLRFQSGIAPLNRFLETGVKVAIGIDEAGINDDQDMLQEMRLVLNLHRGAGIEQIVPKAAQVFQMATEHGAETTGFADKIGSLEVGKAADLGQTVLSRLVEV